MSREVLQRTVRKVLEESPTGLKQLADASGLSYDVLRSWRAGRRSPGKRSVEKLLDGLEQRTRRLARLTAELRGVLDESR